MSLPVVTIFLASGYFLFLGIVLYAWRKQSNRFIANNCFSSKFPLLIFLQLAGIVLLGIIPIILLPSFTERFTEVTGLNTWSGVLTIIIVLVLFLIGPWLAISDSARHKMPHPSLVFPGNTSLAAYFILRCMFIASYELWFRGFLLFLSLQFFDIVAAVLLNVILYSFLHIMNGKKETIACIPFGLLLCLLCIWQRSPWPAMVIHCILAITYELTQLIYLQIKSNRHESLYHGRFRLYRK